MPKTDRFSNNDTKDYAGLYALLTKLSNSSLKADYYYDWLLSRDILSEDMYDRYMYHLRLRLGHDPRSHMSDEGRLQRFEETKSALKNYLQVFNAEGTKELLATAYEEIGRGSATEKLELILGYLNEVSSPKLRLVGDQNDFKAIEESHSFINLAYRTMYIFIGDYRENRYSHLADISNDQRVDKNNQFLIESMYSSQLSSDEVTLVPIRIYKSGLDGGHTVSKLLNTISECLSLDMEYEYRPVIDSWYGRFFGVIKKDKTKDELNDAYEKLKRSLELEYLNKPQSEIDKNLIEAVSSLTQAAATQDIFVAQIGSLLFMKYPDGENRSQVFTRTLSQQELITLNGNQSALSSPDEVLSLLEITNQESISIENPKESTDADEQNA